MNRATIKNLFPLLAALSCVASFISYFLLPEKSAPSPQIGIRRLDLAYHDEAELLWGYLPGENGMSGIAQDFFLRGSNPALMLITLIALCGAVRYIWLSHILLTRKQRLNYRQRQADIATDSDCPACTMRSGLHKFYGHMSRSQNAMTVSVIAAALWPWLSNHDVVLGTLTAVILAAGALMVIWPNVNKSRHRPTGGAGLYAGWALVVLFVTLADLVTRLSFISNTLIVLTATACLAFIGPFIQVRVGPRVGFSIAVIASLIGLATIAIPSDPTASIASVIGITSMTIALVSVSD